MAGEWYQIVYNDVHGIRSVVLRLTNTYGPRMRVKDARQTFLGIWIKKIIESEKILVYGDGTQIRDFNYVDDVVDSMCMSTVSDDVNGEIFNLGAQGPINLKDTAELLIKININGIYELVPFQEDRKKIDIGDYYADYRKIRAKIGWQPQILLTEGLRRTINYYCEIGKYYWEK